MASAGWTRAKGQGSRRVVRLSAMAALLLATLLLRTGPVFSGSAYPLLGKPAPHFSIESGDGKRLVAEAVRGKVTVIFYETREASRKNSDIKDRFNNLYDGQSAEVRNSIVRIPVFDCSRVVWPLTSVWKQSLRYHSKRVGITLYGDWDGRMAKDYLMKDDESNLVIVDRKGTIRYESSGLITDSQFSDIETLLDRLVNGEKQDAR